MEPGRISILHPLQLPVNKLTKPLATGGFTLLEVMVVVVLIGIIASFAVLQIPSTTPAERAYNEAQRLAAVMRQQWQEAVLLGQQRGVLFDENTYLILELGLDNKKWLPLTTNTQSLKRHQLPPQLALELAVEGRPVAFQTNASRSERPQILFLSSGEQTEFKLTLVSENQQSSGYQLTGYINGTITLAVIP